MIGSATFGQVRAVDIKGAHLKQGTPCHLKRLSLAPSTLSVVSENSEKVKMPPLSENLKSQRNCVLSRSSSNVSLLDTHLRSKSMDGTLVWSANCIKYVQDKHGNGSPKGILKRSYTSESIIKQPVSSLRTKVGIKATECVEVPRLSKSVSSLYKHSEKTDNGNNKTGRRVMRRANTCGNFDSSKIPLNSFAKDFENTFRQNKMSWKSLGNKLTGMIRAKNAFRRKSSTVTVDKATLHEFDEEMFVIKTMPEQPRFASMLSAEAQYAMLKGYEDLVFDKMTVSYPECHTSLRRSKTPIANIEVRKEVRRNYELVSGENDSLKQNSEPNNVLTDETSTNDKAAPAKQTSPESTTSASVSCVDGANKTTRHSPDNRKLVMTYRYQSVMDMLDNLRQRDGFNTLSPRLKAQVRTNTTVNDFNSWSVVWEREFEPKVI